MSEVIVGQPWHGVMTTAGLVLADATLKTSMAGTDANGNPKTFNYSNPGSNAIGHTYYVKVPGLAAPETPAGMASIGGEFKNDVVLSGLEKRYCPFAPSGLNSDKWLHYGSDGVWRKMHLVFFAQTTTTHTVKIYRQTPWGRVDGTVYTENTLIATLTLEHTSPVPYTYASFPALDCSFDGRHIVVTRWDVWGGSFDSVTSEGKWENSSYYAIVAAWRIDIAADCASASQERVWQAEAPEKVFTAMPTNTFVATGPVFYTGAPGAWSYWEPYEGNSYGSYGETFLAKRLLGAAFAPDGTLQLIEWSYFHDFQPRYWRYTGTVFRGNGSTTDPVLPASAFPTASLPFPAEEYPSTAEGVAIDLYEITVKSNSTLLYSMDEDATYPIWSVQMTNNVFDLHNASGSLGRFGPGVADATPDATSPLYASFNPRTNTVHTSATPIGFI